MSHARPGADIQGTAPASAGAGFVCYSIGSARPPRQGSCGVIDVITPFSRGRTDAAEVENHRGCPVIRDHARAALPLSSGFHAVGRRRDRRRADGCRAGRLRGVLRPGTAVAAQGGALAAVDEREAAYLGADHELQQLSTSSAPSKGDPARYAGRLDGRSPGPSKWTASSTSRATTASRISSTSTHLEERVYRHRCVEAWSMVIPWIGVPLSSVLNKVKPQPAGQVRRVHDARCGRAR